MLGENDDRVIFNEHGLLVATNFECPICGDTIYMTHRGENYDGDLTIETKKYQ